MDLSRGLGDVYKRQVEKNLNFVNIMMVGEKCFRK
jgi:hypothetical protein